MYIYTYVYLYIYKYISVYGLLGLQDYLYLRVHIVGITKLKEYN